MLGELHGNSLRTYLTCYLIVQTYDYSNSPMTWDLILYAMGLNCGFYCGHCSLGLSLSPVYYKYFKKLIFACFAFLEHLIANRIVYLSSKY